MHVSPESFPVGQDATATGAWGSEADVTSPIQGGPEPNDGALAGREIWTQTHREKTGCPLQPKGTKGRRRPQKLEEAGGSLPGPTPLQVGFLASRTGTR